MLDVNIFDSMRIGLASPEKIIQWSHGEVKKPETINYRTLKPERDGLFCERIFGPTRDWECHCGKYKRVRYKGTICDRCGVEVTRAKVRRERMGHIKLAAPVSHIWYFKGIPSRMGLLLDMSPRALERVLYFASYIVLDPGNTELKFKDIITEGQYRLARDTYGRNAFKVGMGAEAIQELLQKLDLNALSEELRNELNSTNGQKRIRAIRRLEVVEAFRKSGNKPEWMILTVIPVIPPELRPMVQLDGGRFATSDLNDLYRRVINRNNRLNRLLNLKAPDIIVRNEKRMLQEAVDALIDNGRRGRPVTGPGNRPLKSLSDMLKGKQGRFRQNLLGKRVDYSGRSVIVVGPELKLHQCGLPKEMALELFKPFVMKKLSSDNNLTIKAAKRKVERANAEVWGVLEEVIKEHPVLLNRAPTLHRLGIQAFEPVLTEGRALKLHPLACTAYNADFDGDQMAIHLPLSAESQAEARVLMLAANHILAPKDGKPIIVPTQDMVLGTYYLTKERKSPAKSSCFTGASEALLAYEHKAVSLQEPIRVRLPQASLPTKSKEPLLVTTTVGRLIFNEILPVELRQLQKTPEGYQLGRLMNKKELGKLVALCFNKFGATQTAKVIDDVKRLGYHYACTAGMTVAVSDVITPPAKPEILARTGETVRRVESFFARGLITEEERYRQVCALWEKATEEVADAMMANMDEFNPIFMMADSGARGNKQQMRQLAGMRGLMSDPSGKTIDLPITANFREGLSVSDYFISSHGARKGLADTALRTADSGYLTRRLVDVAQDVIVREHDCDVKTVNLLPVRAALKSDVNDALEILNDMLVGSTIARQVTDGKGETLLEKESVLDEDALVKIAQNQTEEITIRVRGKEQTLLLGNLPEERKQQVKDDFKRELLGKSLAREIETAGRKVTGVLTDELLDEILTSELTTIQVRLGTIRGVEVEAILEDSRAWDAYNRARAQLLGKKLAADVIKDDVTVATAGTVLDESNLDKICAATDKLTLEMPVTVHVDGDGDVHVDGDGDTDVSVDGDVHVDAKVDGDTDAKLDGDVDGDAKLDGDVDGDTKLDGDVDGDAKVDGEVDGNTDTKKFQIPNSTFQIAVDGGAKKFQIPNSTFHIAVVDVSAIANPPAKPGVIESLHDRILGRTLAENIVDADGNIIARENDLVDEDNVEAICAVRDKVMIRSVLTCKAKSGVCQKCYGRDLANQTEVEVGEAVGIIAAQSIGEPGTQLTMRTFHTGGVAGGDITQGLPRVEELFEARKPKNGAIISEIDGTVSFGDPDKNNLKTIIVTSPDENRPARQYSIPFNAALSVKEGVFVRAGDNITSGAKNPHDILRICGLKETYRYLVKEVQKVYKSQGVEINDKHIEVMVRQMLHKVRIEDSGDTEFLPGEFVDVNIFESANTKAIEEDHAPAVAKPILLGITKASLATDSFLSAASFQETTRVLTDAAIKGKIDPLIGLKENVIIGKLSPAGTGMARYRELTVIDKVAAAADDYEYDETLPVDEI